MDNNKTTRISRIREELNPNYSEMGKIPPQATELEELVLGAALLEEQAVSLVANLLKSDSFYKEQNQLIFEAIKKVSESSGMVDIVTVTQQLRKDGKLEFVTPLYVSQLTNRIASTAHVEEHCRILEQFAIRRRLIALSQRTIRAAYDDTIDIFDLCDTHNEEFVNLGHADPAKLSLNIYQRQLQHYQKVMDNVINGNPTGMTMGVRAIDSISNGFRTGFYVVGARAGEGKTEFVINVCHTLASKGYPVYFAECEMSDEQMSYREIGREAGMYYSDITDGKIQKSELEKLLNAIEKMKDRPVYVDSVPAITMSKLESKIKYHVKRNKIKVVIVDYLQIMNIIQKKGETRDAAIGRVTQRFKQLATELDLCIIVLSQVKREALQRKFARPQGSDLRESGNIEQDADVIMLLYYPSNYRHLYEQNGGGFVDERGESLDGKLEVIVEKNRFGKPFVSRYLHWDRGKVSYRDVESVPIGYHPDTRIESNASIKSNENFLSNATEDAPF